MNIKYNFKDITIIYLLFSCFSIISSIIQDHFDEYKDQTFTNPIFALIISLIAYILIEKLNLKKFLKALLLFIPLLFLGYLGTDGYSGYENYFKLITSLYLLGLFYLKFKKEIIHYIMEKDDNINSK
ncbi:MAG TPA: hypothetical protein PKC06_17655 [Saprospiraceae bacterium]|jgi:uncharacterized phage infection (PIP) family protein YhgE|nr:hypothetical protein [Saprospiraceae bacterium]